ncbi:hypothetical protein AMJ71_09815 [candidate division TA06 bacterium SM1_40]|uniref:FlgD Ig-like domain-containing protein n=1 Tax=candidate division TA06 bacterium SM1_40 TaxID=1703773 RepID=A0A0S8JCN7_UNCT6|nr:MAG: hypothetical protein AMJ71_09815 [candidate division TA06 bacterium SM1_40]
MRTLTVFACGALMFGWAAGAEATTWYVPSQCPNIQAGIDSAAAGDTVLVADGTYTGDGNRNIDFLGKAILVTSENGPAVTIIDCESVDRAFFFQNDEDSSSVLRGFTITNGNASYGGAIRCDFGSSPTIEGNTITGNYSTDGGGGIYLEYGSPTIVDNAITGNTSLWHGGGIHSYDASPRIVGNTIQSNSADDPTWECYGGGIYCEYGCPVIVGNTITENTVDYLGGGIYCDGVSGIIRGNVITLNVADNLDDDCYGGGIYEEDSPSLLIEYNTIMGNVADWCGSGIASYSSSSTIEDNTIIGNIDTDFGGGIYCEFSNPTIRGNTVAGNCGYYGGGIYCGASSPLVEGNLVSGNESGYGGGVFCDFGSDPSFAGNTIAENLATHDGGGMYCYWSEPTVVNCIFWGDSAGSGNGQEVYLDWDSVINIDYSDIQGGSPGVYVVPGCTLYWGVGNINSNPLFVTGPLGDYYLSQIAAGQGTDSPCVDAGDPGSAVPAGGTTRTDRVADALPVDMGYHYPTNRPPDLVDQPDTTVAENEYLTFTLEVSDPEGDSISFSSPDLPGGAALNAVTGVFEWTPTYQQAGLYTVTFIAMDHGSPALADTEQTDIRVTDVVGVEDVEDGDEGPEIPLTRYLAQNYPNPFRSATTIEYGLVAPTHVSLRIYDVRGAFVRALVNEELGAGHHRASWDGRDGRGHRVGSGIYFCRIEAGDFTETRRMVILR